MERLAPSGIVYTQMHVYLVVLDMVRYVIWARPPGGHWGECRVVRPGEKQWAKGRAVLCGLHLLFPDHQFMIVVVCL